MRCFQLSFQEAARDDGNLLVSIVLNQQRRELISTGKMSQKHNTDFHPTSFSDLGLISEVKVLRL